MTTVAVPSAVVPSRPAWNGLLWTVPFTVLWGWLIYWQPALVEGGFPSMAARLISYGLIALGLWFGLDAADLTPGQRRATWLAIMVPFTLWPDLMQWLIFRCWPDRRRQRLALFCGTTFL